MRGTGASSEILELLCFGVFEGSDCYTGSGIDNAIWNLGMLLGKM